MGIKDIFYFINALVTIYSVLIILRIFLMWFPGVNFGRFALYIARITDPYLNWFRRWTFLRISNIDLTPVAALAFLSILNNILHQIAESGRVSVGVVLGLLVSILWSVMSFIIVFFVVIIVLRLIGYLTGANIYSSFWRVIDYISRPIVFNINNFFFRNKIINYFTGLLVAIISLLALWTACTLVVDRLVVPILKNMSF